MQELLCLYYWYDLVSIVNFVVLRPAYQLAIVFVTSYLLTSVSDFFFLMNSAGGGSSMMAAGLLYEPIASEIVDTPKELAVEGAFMPAAILVRS